MVSIKLLAKNKLGTFEIEYLLKLSEYFSNLAKMFMRSHNKRSCSKVFKALAKFKTVFGLKDFLICLFVGSLIEIIYVPVVVYIS